MAVERLGDRRHIRLGDVGLSRRQVLASDEADDGDGEVQLPHDRNIRAATPTRPAGDGGQLSLV